MSLAHSPTRRLPHSRRGMTLTETVVVIGVMTIVLMIVTQIFIINYDIYVKQSSRIDNDIGAVFSVRRISEASRGASGVLANQTINGTAYASSASTLVLKLPTLDPNYNVVTGSFDYVAFYRDGLEPTKIFSDTQPASGSVRLGGKRLVTAFNETTIFRYNDADVSKSSRVSVFIVNRQTARGATFTTRAWTTLFLRNQE